MNMKSALAKTPAHDAFMNGVSPGTIAHFQINRHYKTRFGTFEPIRRFKSPTAYAASVSR